MTDKTTYPLTPEAKALLEKLVQERDAATQRLDVAVIAMKAALGAPVEYTIRNVDEGFTTEFAAEHEVVNGGNN